MRFLGRKSLNEGRAHPALKGEIVTSLKHRPEGVRIKHSGNNNSIKLYEKQGSVLRVETTLNTSRDLKGYRRKEGQQREFTKDPRRPVRYRGKRIRALRPWEPQELQPLNAIGQGQFLITGVCNRDLTPVMFPRLADSPSKRQRACAAISYRLRILRAHGILAKVPGTHRYLVTTRGRTAITAILAAHRATIEQLTEKAA